MLYTLEFNAPWPLLELDAGHLVVVNSQFPPPYRVMSCKPIPPNYGALLGALEAGVAELVSPGASVADVAEAVGFQLPYPPPSPQPRPRAARPYLYRLK